MGDSPVFNTVKQVAGFGVGTLAALDTIKGGGLGNYLMNRQRLMSDPGFRASLEGSPFQAGVFGVTGSTGPAPAPPSPGMYPATAAGGGVVQPADMVGPPPPGTQVAQPGMPVPTAQNVPGYEPGTPRAWHPLFSPYDPEQANKQLGFATSQIGLGSPDPSVVAQSKMAAGIPLSPTEMHAAIKTGTQMQQELGPGGVVKLDIPGMNATIGSPYNFAAMGNEEYPMTPAGYAAAQAAATGRGPGWTVVPSGRGTLLLAPPPTAQQNLPANVPAPERAAAPAPPPPQTAAAPTPAPQPAPVQPAAPTPPPSPPPPPPPPPSPPPAAAPPSGPPMRGAAAPQIFATPGMGPAYRPPGLPDMAPSVRVAPGSPPGGHEVGFPSPAFDEGPTAAPAPPPAPPPAQPLAMYAKPVAASGGRVDLNSSWLRDLEAARPHLAATPGVLSAMAEKESGGNALRVAQDPNSTAAGLFQITAPTARAWGMTSADRFDPVKAATATADQLERRAAQVGIERAVGMHYGGPGTPYNQVVGSSGLSPASYSGDVLARAQKYTDGTVGYPSSAPTGPVDYRGVPFRLKEPDLRPATLGVAPPPTPGTPFDIGAPARPAGLPAAAPLVDPATGVPLKTVTEHDQHGKEISYTVPDLAGADVAANMAAAGVSDWRTVGPDDPRITYFQQLQARSAQRQKLMEADIATARGSGNTGLRAAMNMYDGYRKALDTYLGDFPKPADRAKYIGWLNQPVRSVMALANTDPRFKQFLADTAAFHYRKPDDSKSADLSDQEQQMLADSLPTGGEPDAASHEMRLANFNNLVNERKAMLTAEVGMTPDQLANPEWWNAANQAIRDQHAADREAAGGAVGGAYVGATLGAPEAAPPEAPPATVPMGTPPPSVAPPPFTVLGQWQE